MSQCDPAERGYNLHIPIKMKTPLNHKIHDVSHIVVIWLTRLYKIT